MTTGKQTCRPIGMSGNGNVIIGDDQKEHICYVAESWQAEKVCNALNTHAEMLEALETVLQWHNDPQQSISRDKMLEAVETAIKSATGGR